MFSSQPRLQVPECLASAVNFPHSVADVPGGPMGHEEGHGSWIQHRVWI